MTRINEISNILLYFESHLQELQFTGDTETKWGVWVQWENVWNHLEWENEIWMENGIIGNMLQRIETFSHKENYFLSFFFFVFCDGFHLLWMRFSFFDSLSVFIQIQWQQFHNNYSTEERRGRFFVWKCMLFSADILLLDVDGVQTYIFLISSTSHLYKLHIFLTLTVGLLMWKISPPTC